MEIAGFSIGIAGLARLFSTCLDVIERIDSYRDFDVDSQAIISQFDADILLFKKWGKAVGLEGSQLKDEHHESLNDATTLSAVRSLLLSVSDIVGDPDGPLPSRQPRKGLISTKRNLNDPQYARLDRFREGVSPKAKMIWSLRHKARFLAISQQFGNLVGRLRDLVPPDTSSAITIGRQVRESAIASTDALNTQPTGSFEKSSRYIDSQRILMEIEKQIQREMKKELDTWLAASIPDSVYKESIQKRLPDTCDWITDRDAFRDWESPNFAPNDAKVLWINGPAGYGKTILSARVVQYLEAQNNSTLAVFFFSADLENRDDPFIVARSWILQIISQNPETFSLAYEKLILSQSRIASSSEVMELFQVMIQTVPNCTFVVDGLDECSSKGPSSLTQNGTLNSFIRMTMQAISDTNSRMFIASREDQEIRGGLLETHARRSMGIKLFEYKITPLDVRPDATRLSQSIVNQKLEHKSEALRAEIVQRMVDRCDSMLLRIKLLENDIRGGKNQKQLERIVDQTPSELGNLYDRNWKRIMERGNDRPRALAILRWAAFGLRPLTVSEMTEALLLTEPDVINDLEDELPDEIDEQYVKTEILELCASLIEIRTAAASADSLGSSTVHLTHFTVRQYILVRLPASLNNMMKNENLASSNESVQHNILSEACLRYLTTSHPWTVTEPGGSHYKWGSFQDYATDSWNKHARREAANYAPVSKLVIDFFGSGTKQWENWRRHHDSSLTDSTFLKFTGEITSGSPLFYASLLGLQEVVQELVECRGVDVDYVDESGRSGLLAAVHERHLGVLQYLLHKNTDINKASNEGRTPLYVASGLGDNSTVRLLLGEGADWSIPNKYGYTALNIASDHGHIAVVRMLLEKGADLTASDKDGWTPMVLATYHGNMELVQLLLENGAGVTISNNKGWTPLHSASNQGHREVAQLLLKKGADPKAADNEGSTPLTLASGGGHIEVVQLLLENGADLTVTDNDGWTPLNLAAFSGHKAVVQLLLKNGADLTVVDNKGWTPLRSASYNGNREVVQLLLENGADLTVADINGWRPLNSASDMGRLEVVRLLLENGADLTVASNRGWTSLSLASYKGHREVVQLLLENGADAAAADEDGWTPLHSASDKGHKEVAQVLLENGADLTAVDNVGWTPLTLASEGGHIEVLQLLLEKGADLAVAAGGGWTSLNLASYGGHREVVQLLLEKGADLTVVDDEGWTALALASNHGRTEVVQLLLEKGADLAVVNNDGWTPLTLASSQGRTEVAQRLLKNSADINNAANISGWTPINRAASNGHIEVVKLLLKEGASISIPNKSGRTPLHSAADGGHFDVVCLLRKESEPDIHLWDDLGRPAAFYAIKSGNFATFDALQYQKSLPSDYRDFFGSSALSLAVRCGHEEMIRALAAYSSQMFTVADRFGRTPLWWARKQGHLPMVESIAGILESESQTQPPLGEPAKFKIEGRECDICLVSLEKTFYNCKICYGGDFDLCLDCQSLGAHCLVDTHVLIMKNEL